MALSGLPSAIVKSGKGSTGFRWSMSVGYLRPDQTVYHAYCPVCLQEDETPYFRIAWQLSFVTACSKHLVLLHDRCPRCGAPAWPGPLSSVNNFSRARRPIECCLHCAHDLREAVCVTAVASKLTVADRILIESSFDLGPSGSPLSEQMDALWVMVQLMLNPKTNQHFRKQSTFESLMARQIQALEIQNLEDLSLIHRHGLMRWCAAQLTDWPEKFLETCRRNRLSKLHFTFLRHWIPDWMSMSIHRNLTKCRYPLSQQEVMTACHELSTQGLPVTKAAVSRHLGGVQSEKLTQTLGRRYCLELHEVQQYLGELTQILHRPTKRVGIGAMHARNVLMVVLALVTEWTMDKVADLTKQEVASSDEWSKVQDLNDPFRHQVIGLIAQAKAKYETYVQSTGKWGDEPGLPYFIGYRQGVNLSREANQVRSTLLRQINKRFRGSADGLLARCLHKQSLIDGYVLRRVL